MKYLIKEEITEIYITNKKGKEFLIKIDTEDLQRVLDKNEFWHVAWFEKSKAYYAVCANYIGIINGKPKGRTILLNRFIMKAEKKTIVDHENHDTLDNRKSNLRLASVEENGKNRKGKNSNNSSGYRNVSKQGKWWCVQLQIDGKNTVLKKFPLDKVDDAGAYAELMREKYYGVYQGAN